MTRATRDTLSVFAAGATVRLLLLWQLADAPTFQSPILDAEASAALAGAALRHGGFPAAMFCQSFFYPATLVATIALGDGSLLLPRLLQVLLGGITCALTFRLAQRFLSARGSLIAGFAAALYGPLAFFDTELLPAGWATFWMIALLLQYFETRDRPTSRNAVVFGLAAALAVLTSPAFVPLVVLGGLHLVWRRLRETPGPRAAAFLAVVLAIGFLVPTVPVALLSRSVSGAFSMFPYSGGINLYIGNNPDSDQTVAIRPGWEWDNLTRLPGRYGIAPGRDTSRFFTREVLRYVRRDPLDFLGGVVRKSIQFCSSRELPRNIDIMVYREWSGLLSGLVWRIGPFGFPFGILLPLALAGVWRLRGRAAVPALAVLVYAAGVVLVFPGARYRLPIVPPLLVLAAAGVGAFAGATRRRRAVLACAGAAVALVTSLPGPFPQERCDYRAEMDYCLGVRHTRQGLLAEAIGELERAVSRDPAYADARNALGVAYERAGHEGPAAAQYAAAMRANPRHLTARLNFAGACYRAGQLDQAATLYEQAAQLAPRDADIRHKLAMALVRAGKREAAITQFYEAVNLEPNDAAIHNNLGSALNEADRPSEAIRHFQAAIQLDPDLDTAVDNLGIMLSAHGYPEQAAVLYQAAVERARARGDREAATHFAAQLQQMK